MINKLSKDEADALASLLRQINDREVEDATTPIALTLKRANILLDMIVKRKVV